MKNITIQTQNVGGGGRNPQKCNYFKMGKTVLLSTALLIGAHFMNAQGGKGNNGTGKPILDPCEFATNVQMIGETSPEVGLVQTYTLQNADATVRKIWKVQGAYQIDGQLASSINNEVTKPGNSIDVIWDDVTQNPNGKIIVRKELPCMAQQRRREIIFPVHPKPLNGPTLTFNGDNNVTCGADWHYYYINYVNCGKVEYVVKGVTGIRVKKTFDYNGVPSPYTHEELNLDPNTTYTFDKNTFECSFWTGCPPLDFDFELQFNSNVSQASVTSNVASCGFLGLGGKSTKTYDINISCNQQCDWFYTINGANNIDCGTSANLTYTIAGAADAQTINWSYSGGNIISGQGTRTLVVSNNGNGGQVSATISYPLSCGQNPYTQTKHITSNKDPFIISTPKCAYVDQVPKYRVQNGQDGVTYTWDISINGGSYQYFSTTIGNALVEKTSTTTTLLGSFPTDIDLRITASSPHCHTVNSVEDIEGDLLHWIPTGMGGNNYLPVACEPDPVSIISNPNNGNGTLTHSTVDESKYGTEMTYEEYMAILGMDVETEKTAVEETKTYSGTLTEVYPNPANNQVTIRGEFSSYKLLNLQGKVLSEGTLNNKQAEINTTNLPVGLYLVELSKENAKFVRKIQIIH